MTPKHLFYSLFFAWNLVQRSQNMKASPPRSHKPGNRRGKARRAPGAHSQVTGSPPSPRTRRCRDRNYKPHLVGHQVTGEQGQPGGARSRASEDPQPALRPHGPRARSPSGTRALLRGVRERQRVRTRAGRRPGTAADSPAR